VAYYGEKKAGGFTFLNKSSRERTSDFGKQKTRQVLLRRCPIGYRPSISTEHFLSKSRLRHRILNCSTHRRSAAIFSAIFVRISAILFHKFFHLRQQIFFFRHCCFLQFWVSTTGAAADGAQKLSTPVQPYQADSAWPAHYSRPVTSPGSVGVAWPRIDVFSHFDCLDRPAPPKRPQKLVSILSFQPWGTFRKK